MAMTRRTLLGGALAGAAGLGAAGCSANGAAYEAMLADMTRTLPPAPEFHDLVRYATLAASGHNTQPWWFIQREGAAEIRPDFTRRTRVVDPDDHHLFASLGCAAENLGLAARARGLSGEIGAKLNEGDAVRVDLTPGPREEAVLFAAIPARQCSRSLYDGRQVPAEALARVAAAASVRDVQPILITDRREIEAVLALVVEGNGHQVDDAAFVAELKSWIRFNASAAAEKRDGLYAAATGNPELPGWLGSILFNLFFTKRSENDKAAAQVRSSAGLALFVAARDDKAGWVSAGRAYQRFALQATVEGLRHAFINQAVEVPDVRRELQSALGLGARRPNLLVRFGYGPAMPRSPRRPANDVIMRENT